MLMTRVKDLVCSSLKVKASERGGEGDAGVELLPRCCALFDRVDLADLGATGRALRVALLQDIASAVTGLAVKRLRDALAHSGAPEAAKQRLASLATQTLEAAIRGASGGEPEQARLAGLLVAELAQVQGWGEVELARRAERVVSWNARRLEDARKALEDLQRRKGAKGATVRSQTENLGRYLQREFTAYETSAPAAIRAGWNASKAVATPLSRAREVLTSLESSTAATSPTAAPELARIKRLVEAASREAGELDKPAAVRAWRKKAASTCAVELAMAVVADCHSRGGCDARAVMDFVEFPGDYFEISEVCEAPIGRIRSIWPGIGRFIAKVLEAIAPPRGMTPRDQLRSR